MENEKEKGTMSYLIRGVVSARSISHFKWRNLLSSALRLTTHLSSLAHSFWVFVTPKAVYIRLLRVLRVLSAIVSQLQLEGL